VNLPLAQAQQQLAAQTLGVEVREVQDPSKPDGVVLAQSPSENQVVPVRTTVQLTVNRLPTVAVPNVGGMEEAEARRTLEQQGFKIRVERDKGGRRGVVYDQSPEPGIKVPPGTTVTVVIGS
jgi:serine/threonine-protein kinase